MALKFFVCPIWKNVETVNKTFFKTFQTASIIEIFENKSILLPAILFYNQIYLNDVTTWVDVLKLQI